MARNASVRDRAGDGEGCTKSEPPIPFALPRVSRTKAARALDLLGALREHYPDAHCELNFRSPHELLVATILSAQATDAGVNKATPALFARFPTPADYAAASPSEIEPFIRSIGLYRNKAKAIHAAMTTLVHEFAGEVPRTMDELLTLRGVARKTANVVLGNAFGINAGFVVDTHIERLAKRFGLAPEQASVTQVERWLMALFPRASWCDASHMLIWHGRRACKARMARCATHPICARFGACCELERPNARAKTVAKAKRGQDASGKRGTIRSKASVTPNAQSRESSAGRAK